MMQSPLTIAQAIDRVDISLPDPLPIGRLVVGRTVEEAAQLLPRLFNLCSMAQEVAIRLALDLPLSAQAHGKLLHDILLEHLAKFFVFLPPLLELRPASLPQNWRTAPEQLLPLVFGEDGRMPRSLGEFKRWLAADEGLAPVMAAIGARFLPGEATCQTLAQADPDALFTHAPLENSLAGRHATHPLLQDIEARHGRGPLWRAAGRLADLDACLKGDLPKSVTIAPGKALVPAARGTYAVEARAVDGTVTGFRRVTPTDHMLAPGGVMEQCMASLPSDRHGEAKLITALLDPCVPVRFEEPAHA